MAAIFLLFFFLIPTIALAASVTWDGEGADDNWSTAANWSGDAAPGAADTALFDGTGQTDAILDSSFGGTVSRLQTTAAFTGTITVRKNLTINENLLMSGGTLNANTSNYTLTVKGSWVNEGGTFTAGTGTVLFTGTGTTHVLKEGGTFNNLYFDYGLDGYWRLDDGLGSTTVADESRSGINGSLTSMSEDTSWSTTTATSINYADEGSIELGGSNERVTIWGVPNNQRITWAVWTNPYQKMCNLIYRNSHAVQWVRVLDGDYFSARIRFSDGTNVDMQTDDITYNQWYHVALSYDGANTWLYLNGVVADSGSYVGTLRYTGATQSFAIGNSVGGGCGYSGLVDEVRYYERALTLSEIASLASGNPHTDTGKYTLESNLAASGNIINYTSLIDTSSSDYSITVSGSLLNHAGLTANSSVITLDGADQNLGLNDASVETLTISSTSGTTLTTNATVTNTLTVGAGSTLTLGAYTLTATNAIITNAGTISANGGLISHNAESLSFTNSSYSSSVSSGNAPGILYVSLTEGDENFLSDTTESVSVTFTTSEGDSETITLTESSISSGIFRGSINAAETNEVVHTGNGIVEVINDGSATVTVTFTDSDDSLSSTATLTLVGTPAEATSTAAGGGGGGGGSRRGSALTSQGVQRRNTSGDIVGSETQQDDTESQQEESSQAEGSKQPAWTDFSSSHPHSEATIKLYNEGIVKGHDDNTIKLNSTLTRAEALTLIARTIKQEDSPNTSLNFKDINPTSWYAGPLRTAVEKGFIKGFPDGTFRPAGTLNTVQSFKLISIGLGLSEQQEEETSVFWYDPYVSVGKNEGLITDSVDLAKPITRGEFFGWLVRLLRD